MAFILAFSKNDKPKVRSIGKKIDILALLVAMSKATAEQVAKESGVSAETAERIVVDCIKDGMKFI